MALPGETVLNGDFKDGRFFFEFCDECKQRLRPGVYKSGAGWYIGTYCDCGPYSRDSFYYGSKEEAMDDFENRSWRAR